MAERRRMVVTEAAMKQSAGREMERFVSTSSSPGAQRDGWRGLRGQAASPWLTKVAAVYEEDEIDGNDSRRPRSIPSMVTLLAVRRSC
jgi:hypothetical protein